MILGPTPARTLVKRVVQMVSPLPTERAVGGRRAPDATRRSPQRHDGACERVLRVAVTMDMNADAQGACESSSESEESEEWPPRSQQHSQAVDAPEEQPAAEAEPPPIEERAPRGASR